MKMKVTDLKTKLFANPARVLVLGFGVVILIGTSLLLSLIHI